MTGGGQEWREKDGNDGRKVGDDERKIGMTGNKAEMGENEKEYLRGNGYSMFLGRDNAQF